MQQLHPLTKYEACVDLLNRGIPLSHHLLQTSNNNEINALIESVNNPKLKYILKHIADYDQRSSNVYPILFRGAHLAELDINLKLSEIQGRPEDTSYNGNVLHLAGDYPTAVRYAVTNSYRDFPDKRVAIMVYDTSELAKYGTFGPDIVDGSASMTPLESLQHCSQVRWSNYHESGQQQRLSSLIRIC